MSLAVVLSLGLFGSVPYSQINVFAAASLKDAFSMMGHQFESSHPGTRVNFNFAGSQTLAAQIKQGAPADVFASAAMKNLLDVPTEKGSVRVFAHNRLIIVLPKKETSIKTVKDISTARRVILADVSVPAGKYAEQFLTTAAKGFGKAWLASVRSHIVSRELDVRAVLTKVRLGEANVGIVYVSDAFSAAKEVRTITIPDELNQLAKYPAAVLAGAGNKIGARQFVEFLLTKPAQTTLEANGFITPPKAVGGTQTGKRSTGVRSNDLK